MAGQQERYATQEEWRAIPGWERTHRVSNNGKVSRLHKNKETELRTHKDRWGYERVTLCANGKKQTATVHRLVATAFLGPIPAGMHVLHGPEGKSCNRVYNLRIGTAAENAKDRIRDGTIAIGSRNGRAKLTEEHVVRIKLELEQGSSVSTLARDFNVSRKAIYLIKATKNWAWLS